MQLKVVIAPDSFKGFFTADEAAAAMAQGVRRAAPDAAIDLVPMADGGEGSLAGVLRRVHGLAVKVPTVDSYGKPIDARYGVHGTTAWIEMAQSGGLHFLPEGADVRLRRELALRASTFGTGLLVRAALLQGAATVYLMLGGSGTTDGGFGLLAALGARYFDADGHLLDGRDSRQLDRFYHLGDLQGAMRWLRRAIFVVAADVGNPLCGPEGAAFTYGPQKGLDLAAVRQRDGELVHWAEQLSQMAADPSVRDRPGTGAAGGTAFPLAVFAPNTRWISGAEFMAETCGLELAIRQADIVLTGEGATDAQTMSGKVPYVVLKLCHRHQKPCGVVSGRLDEGHESLRKLGPVHFEQASPAGANADDVRMQGMAWIAAAAQRAVEQMMRA